MELKPHQVPMSVEEQIGNLKQLGLIIDDEEREFNVAKSGVYSRGDVIKVNLGFNIGNELGGLHYCIVLNKYDNIRNGTLNVIPLTSRKDNKKYDSSSTNLGQELYNVFQEKL